MPQVKVKENFQVTIPATIRKQLNLNVGDLLEAVVENDEIVLKPQVILERAKAFEQLQDLLHDIHERNQHYTDEEVRADVDEAIKRVRKKSHGARRP